jgi:hypothetical protein
MRFLRSVSGYIRIDNERNTDDNKLIFSIWETKMKEYKLNILELILRMPIYRIHQKLFDYNSEGRRESSTIEEMEEST